MIVEQSSRRVVAVRQSTLVGGQQIRQTLTRYNPGSTNPDLATAYASFGAFEYDLSSGTTQSLTDYRPFTYGIVTPVTGVPTTGSVSYSGLVAGKAIDSSGAATGGVTNYEVTGQITLVIDYAAHTVTGTVVLRGQAIGSATPSPISLGSLTLTASTTATSARFGGTAGNDGTLSGLLAGPTAQEAGLVIVARLPDPAIATRTQRIALSGVLVRN